MRSIILVLLCLIISGCATTNKECVSKTSKSSEKNVSIIDTAWLDKVINVFSEELKARPNQSGIYYNRAVAYYYKKEYDLSWKDVRQAQKLSGTIDPAFLKKLTAASGVKE
ncbi:MAG: hypothetical protein NTZ92_03060 [Candidatus Omnitrophica bacterium]|nr:hypothetical protein [Candidatus Omnitrophota bacterium]